MADSDIMTAREVAGYLKLKERTVNNLAMKGKLPGVKIGRQWRFQKAQIDAIFAGGEMPDFTE
jgi:excisionase family DNA binding protein